MPVAASEKKQHVRQYESLDEVAVLFDPETQKPQVWYSSDPKGELQFFSEGQYNPNTGEKLQPLTPKVLREHRAAQQETRRKEQKQTADEQRAALLEQQRIKEREEQAAGEFARQEKERAQRLREEKRRAAFVTNPSAMRSDLTICFDDAALEAAVRRQVLQQGVGVAPPLFLPAFYTSTEFAAVLRGDREVLAKLGVARPAAPIAVGSVQYQTERAKSQGELFSANGSVEGIVYFPTGQAGTFAVSVSGVGFSERAAREQARSRLARALLADPVFHGVLGDTS